jgi:hypothetical protein
MYVCSYVCRLSVCMYVYACMFVSNALNDGCTRSFVAGGTVLSH